MNQQQQGPGRRYVVRKIGERYVSVAEDAGGMGEALAQTAGGAVLVLTALRERGLLGLLAAGAGVELLGRGLTGRSPWQTFTTGLSGRSTSAQESGPSFAGDERGSRQRPTDSVDEGSMESFPASDPPARNSTTA